MISDIHLVAVVRKHKHSILLRIPLHKSLQDHLVERWNSESQSLIHKFEQIDFIVGYKLERHQCFRFLNFNTPRWISEISSHTITTLDEIGSRPELYKSIQGVVASTRTDFNRNLLLFQDLSRSKVIDPGNFLRFVGNSVTITEHPGILLDRDISGVYLPQDKTLLFRHFRSLNSFLPIFEHYRKESEQEIRSLFEHSILVTNEPDRWIKDSNQWFRTRFLLLRNSGILDRYSADQIKTRAIGYGVSIRVVNERIEFPSDYESAKKLLKFLNEEYFKGAITDTIYETNSKTKNDNRSIGDS